MTTSIIPISSSSVSFTSNSAALETEYSSPCKLSDYRNIGTIHNCSNMTQSIAIISMHIENKETQKTYALDAKRILKNHLSYTMHHEYIYIEITNDPQKSHKSRKQILLSKFETVYQVLMDYDEIEYFLWIDFDILFWNCSNRMETSIIRKANDLYSNSESNIIFAYTKATVINSGVIMYRNTKWTKSFLLRLIAMSYKFINVIHSVHPWADQNVFIAALMGYNDKKYKYNNSTKAWISYLLMDPVYNGLSISNATWIWLGDDEQSKYLHSKLDIDIQSYVAVLSPFDMNFGFEHLHDDENRNWLPYQPFIIHYYGPDMKGFISSNKQKKGKFELKLLNKYAYSSKQYNSKRFNILKEPTCFNITTYITRDINQ